MRVLVRPALGAAAAAALAGCAPFQTVTPPLQPQTPPAIAQPMVASVNGSLFIPGAHVSLFKDHRLWHPGDLVTIDIAQNATASTTDGSNLQKNSSAGLGISTLFGAKPHAGEFSPNVSSSSALQSKGTGSNSASNSVQAEVTAVVTRVEPNGVLNVAGRTNVNVDGNVRTVEITGLVRPQDIGPDNSVSSDAIADMNVQYVGIGPTESAQRIPGGLRWLAKFWPF